MSTGPRPMRGTEGSVSMDKVLRTAVVGLGRIGWQYHIPSIRANPGFRLVAVVDPLEDRRAEASREFGVEAHSDVASMLEAARPDLVVLASPSHVHADQALFAMRQGANVFCDKPMAATLADADRMVDGMRATGRKLMIYQPHRCTPEALALKAFLARGLIGPVFLVQRSGGWYTRRNDWQAFRKYGGGMLNNSGSHYIDWMLDVVRSPVRRVTAHMKAIATLGDAEDVVKIVMETADGTTLDLTINMATAAPDHLFQVHGQHGSVWLEADRKTLRARYYDPAEAAFRGADDGLAARDRKYGNPEDAQIVWKDESINVADYPALDYYAKAYEYFVLGMAPYVPIEESREVIRLLDQCRRDAGWA